MLFIRVYSYTRRVKAIAENDRWDKICVRVHVNLFKLLPISTARALT